MEIVTTKDRPRALETGPTPEPVSTGTLVWTPEIGGIVRTTYLSVGNVLIMPKGHSPA